MFWNDDVPRLEFKDDAGNTTEVTVVAGALGDKKPQSPPPDSWASQADSDVAIWTMALEPNAELTLPAAKEGSLRTLYFFKGETLNVCGDEVPANHVIQVEAEGALHLKNGAQPSEVLLLQGRPIGEPVAKYGPFVMNTEDEIHQAVADYQATRFGGWPWPENDPVHGPVPKRFAKHADGRTDEPT